MRLKTIQGDVVPVETPSLSEAGSGLVHHEEDRVVVPRRCRRGSEKRVHLLARHRLHVFFVLRPPEPKYLAQAGCHVDGKDLIFDGGVQHRAEHHVDELHATE